MVRIILLAAIVFIIAVFSLKFGVDKLPLFCTACKHAVDSADLELNEDVPLDLNDISPVRLIDYTNLIDLSTIKGTWRIKEVNDTTGDYSFSGTIELLEAFASFQVEQTVTSLQVKLDSIEVKKSGFYNYLLRLGKKMDGSDLDAVNFAGRYILCQTSCGTECVVFWIIDAITGTIQKGRSVSSGCFVFPKSRLLLIDYDYPRIGVKRPVLYMCDDGVLRETTIELIDEHK